MDYKELTKVKDKINYIKGTILEGIQIRSRIEEQVEGEKLSHYLINKQKTISKRKLMAEIVTENLGNEWGWKGGEILKNSDSILLYVRNYYESLLGNKDKGDVDLQTVFLDHIRESVTPHENEDLIKEVTSLELKKLINCMNKNKTPGIDGLPVEFYCKMWNIIGREFLRVVQLILKENALVASQRMSVIALIPKDGDTRFIKNWRPISMLTVDYKIIAKLISNRLSLILPKLISKEQFCSIPGRNIIDCNLLIRDMVYYINEKI